MAKRKIQTTIIGSINIQSAKGNSEYLKKSTEHLWRTVHTRTLVFIIRKENAGKYAQRFQRFG
jgi:hypothetical protein